MLERVSPLSTVGALQETTVSPDERRWRDFDSMSFLDRRTK